MGHSVRGYNDGNRTRNAVPEREKLVVAGPNGAWLDKLETLADGYCIFERLGRVIDVLEETDPWDDKHVEDEGGEEQEEEEEEEGEEAEDERNVSYFDVQQRLE